MMRKTAGRAIVLLGVIFVLLVISGCGEQAPRGVKTDKLLAAENIQLKKEMSQQGKEIATLKKQLEKAQEEGGKVVSSAKPGISEDMANVMMETIGKLGEENTALKAEIAKLKK